MKSLIKSLLHRSPGLERYARGVHKRFRDRVHFRSANQSYAQLGEDLIVACLLNWLGISKPTYLDIGAHHPSHLSNTYLFYRRGHRGVCIEPDPYLFARIARARPGDVHLNVGIGIDNTENADFYVMSERALNTFSADEARKYVESGHQIEQIIKVGLVDINRVIRERFKPCPNFVSLDVEGLDHAVIRMFDFKSFRPEVFCIETVDQAGMRKSTEVIDLMRQNDYEIFADTFINTIFVDGPRWRKLQLGSLPASSRGPGVRDA